jgi:outer membrane protein assembly factor BamB
VDGPAVAFGNDRESLLYVASAEDGKELARYPLDSSPVFDGMAAAYGRLYISTEEGRVICFSEKTIASN